MRIILLGAAGFIGTNLTMALAQEKGNEITVVDTNMEYFQNIIALDLKNITIKESNLDIETDFQYLLQNQEIVYHLISTTVPGTSNRHISDEITANVVMTAKMLDACVVCKVEKVVFLSSGGAVYGKSAVCPIKENSEMNPISSYGLQKITIEKLLYLYGYIYGIDYRIIRLANPYGPYQRPDGVLGVITTFIYKALKNESIEVFGDGTVVRDFIYIEDAIRAIIKICNGSSAYHVFNVGCGHGISIGEVLQILHNTVASNMDIVYLPGRKADVPVNYLDITRYEEAFGKLLTISIEDGIRRTSDFLKGYYNL